MKNIDLTKKEESLFILNRIATNIITLRELESLIKLNVSNEEKSKIYLFHIYNSIYLYIAHFLDELQVFNNLSSQYDEIKNIFIELKDDLKVLYKARGDIREYRNKLIGHDCRDKKGNFVHVLDLLDKPCTEPELFFYAEYCFQIFIAIRKTFDSDLKISIQKVKDYAYNAERNKSINVNQLNEIITALKIKYNNKFM